LRRDKISGPQAKVETSRDNIDDPSLGDEVDMHLGIALQEREDERPSLPEPPSQTR
jgi:hypothetical protein